MLGYSEFKLQYILDTNENAVEVGAVLLQIQEAEERVKA